MRAHLPTSISILGPVLFLVSECELQALLLLLLFIIKTTYTNPVLVF